jgi:hypothetical protein
MAQQAELIEHQQKACRVSAGVDAIELSGVKHVLGACAHHMVCCAGNGANAPIEPGTCRSNRLALCRR